MTYPDPLAALGDPTRRTVLERLRDGPLAVVEIARGLPVSRPAVSQHLRVLREAGLVTERAEGTRRFYAIDETGIASARAYLDGLVAERGGPVRSTGTDADRGRRAAAPAARRRREGSPPGRRPRDAEAAATTATATATAQRDSSRPRQAEAEAGGKKPKGKKGKRRGKSKG